MRVATGFFVLSAVAIVAVWTWLGAPIPVPQAPFAPGEKLDCVSYAPFRGSQSPLVEPLRVEPRQIDDDLARLAPITRCVRTYATDMGLEHVPEIAARHGLEVIQGIWISRNPVTSQKQIDTGVALANKHANIRALVVGNEVLLRGERTAGDLTALIRGVKAQVKVPVTYADVWEFWVRNPSINEVTDFITIHILPYWEDFPIPADQAGAHVANIRRHVAEGFPGREILIGEVGWPSAGRMREGALPSAANQARVVQDVMALAKREKFRVNVIEAFDQPWKRQLEGTVGGHWGFLDADTRTAKFVWGEAVSNHPRWTWNAVGGVLFAALVFAAAYAARSREFIPAAMWAGVAAIAVAGGVCAGWTIANIPLESLGTGGWLRSIALAAVSLAAPPIAAAALMGRRPIPAFSEILNRDRVRDPVALALGVALIVTTVLAIVVALGLVFDPRYRDFPFAPMTAATASFAVLALFVAQRGERGVAETVAAGVLALSVVYILPNEGFGNWQSLWLCLTLAALALTLARVRGARG